ncbi:MAG: leucine-rich repeat protein [Treponemataceae bacterium]|nr:leucine-rich repeat protein [Treponemataceae bacterium]
MTRTRIRFLTGALLAALLLAAGCGSDDEDDMPAAEYKVLGGRLVWCAETLESLTVPDSTSSIGNNAFNNCPALTKVTIPATVEKIGSGTFYGVAVREITYMSTMRAWDALARASGIVSTLATITVRCTDGIWRTGMYDWEITDGVLTRYCGDAADVTIPKGVTAIGEAAFEGRADITGVTIPSGVTAIGDGAFKDCAKLTDIEIPSGVTSIGENAFDGCDGLTGVDIPASVTDIGAGAIPAGTTVTYHGTKAQWDALAGNTRLDGITVFIIDENGTLTGYCGSAADITLPDGVTGIAGGAFADHAELERVAIPESVTKIDPGTFTESGITKIEYGGTMTEWGALTEAGGIAAEVADITVECADGTWTPAHRHDWSAYTDGGDGTHRRTCADCGRTESAPHAYDGETYTVAGHIKTCAGCRYSETAQHTWGDAYTDDGTGGHYQMCTVAECGAQSCPVSHEYEYRDNADGSHTKTCKTDCGYSEDIDHNWSDYTSDSTDTHSRTCTAAGFKAHTERAAHTYGTTYTDNGSGKHYQTCSVCDGQSKAVEHDYEYEDNANGTHTTTCTKCEYSKTERHRYKDDTCEVCGCPDPTKVYVASTGSDSNSGDRAHPFATIQKAVDTVIENNDGASAYTIYVDGTLSATTTTYIGASGMADFTALDKNLNLTIKALSGTATLDGGARFDSTGNVTNPGIGKGIIFAKSEPDTDGKVNLTLENLIITGGNKAGNGAGVYLNSPGGTLTIGDGMRIIGNRGGFGGGVSINSGAFTMTGGTVSGNWSTENSGGVDIGTGGASFTMTGGTISGNTAQYGGGMLVASGGTVTMSGGEISGNTATVSGGGVHNRGTFAMSSGKITDNTAPFGNGIYEEGGTFTQTGGTVQED